MIESAMHNWGDNGYVSTHLNVNKLFVEWVPVGNVCLRDWKHSFYKIFQKLEYHQSFFKQIRWLNDLTNFESAGLAQLKFLQQYVNGKAGKYFPPIKIAFVKPKDLLGLAAMHGYTSPSTICCARVNIKVFDTKEQALEWLNK